MSASTPVLEVVFAPNCEAPAYSAEKHFDLHRLELLYPSRHRYRILASDDKKSVSGFDRMTPVKAAKTIKLILTVLGI
jgi:hypothetical protein